MRGRSTAASLSGPNWTNPVTGYAAYLNPDSWVDHHLLNVVTLNVDALRLSAYFHKPRNGRLEFGPLWDFDMALREGCDTSAWLVNRAFSKPAFWKQLFDYPPFHQSLCDRYHELRMSAWSDKNLTEEIDALAAFPLESMQRNQAIFPWPANGFWPYETVPQNFEAEIILVKNRLLARLRWMDWAMVGN